MKHPFDNLEGVEEYKWKGANSQTTEVIYGLVKMKCVAVGGQDADKKDMVFFFKEMQGA